MGSEKMLLFCFLLASSHMLRVAAQSELEENENSTSGEISTDKYDLSHLIGKTLNFSHFANNTNGVQLTLMKKPIDFNAVVVDASNVKLLQGMLRGRNISEFLYVTSHLAGIEARMAAQRGKTITTLKLEAICNPESDTVYDASDIDEFLRELEMTDNGQTQGHTRTKRKALAQESSRWPTTIPYIISEELEKERIAVTGIQGGIKMWEDETCLTFTKGYYFTGSHIVFKRDKGCWSKIGRQLGNIAQIISIDRGCESVGVVAHEIGHALGYLHEHQRFDRDQYVTVNYGNIKEGDTHNFAKRIWNDDLSKGVPYDYSSIMHYHLKAFSTGSGNTLSVKEEGADTLTGSHYVLSFYDVKLANLMYCTEKCTGGLVWDACQNDGYRDPKDCNRCKCPDGWTGRYCTEIQSGVNVDCGAKELVPTSSWSTMTSPGYDTSTVGKQDVECTWRIRTNTENTRIVIRFKDDFRLPCYKSRGTCESYVEIRNKDMAKAGPRYCCYTEPEKDIISHGNEVLLLLRLNKGHYWKGFNLEYKLEPCGCSSNNNETSLPACLDTQTYSCPDVFWGYRTRENTCYKELKTCCDDFKLVGDKCFARLSAWSDWSTCSKTCDSGTQTRTRTCLRLPCSGSVTETQECNESPCSITARLSAWSDWSTCSKTCDSGTQTRTRTCLRNPCSESLKETQSCKETTCPNNGGWSNWNGWTTCTATCDTGSRMRFRDCYNPPCRNGTWHDYERCNTQSCNGGWSNWFSWSGCSRTCGSGSRVRNRACYKSYCSGARSETKSCNIRECSGLWSNWNGWSSCSVTCGSGTKSRTRTCPNPPCSGSSTQTDSCKLSTCPGQWSIWYSWSSCSTTCGSGSRIRWRFCRKNPCIGSKSERSVCNTNLCPDQWNTWNPWTSCSVTCGNGTRTRTRTCRYYPCSGTSTETATCNNGTCVVASWSAWNSWSSCSKTCGFGFQIRSRSCNNQPCSGPAFQGKLCDNNPCQAVWSPWTSWSSCSKTCGTGTRTRSRSCPDSHCSGSLSEQQTCNNDVCLPRGWCTKRVRCDDLWGRTRYCLSYYIC